jgi:hypothetical protein
VAKSTPFIGPILSINSNSRNRNTLTQAEVDYISTQIQNLVPTQDLMEGERYISVTHKPQLTTIDGKVCNALTTTLSSQICYVCGATPTEMNKLDVSTRKEVDVIVYEFDLSTLHAWIRFFATHFVQAGSEEIDSETGPGESPAKKTLNTGKVPQRDGLTG